MLRAAVLLVGVSLGVSAVSTDTLTVSAAVSLTDVMQAIASAYERAGGGRITFNFAASNVLARQVANGAPVDVFISADEAQMDLVAKSGRIEAGSRLPVARNQLAVVVRIDATGLLTSPAALGSPAIRRIAIGDPAAVPAGVYAKQYLERMGLWTALERKLLPTASVRAALATVANGAADAGIVYVTDARASRNVRNAFIIEGSDAPDIVYPACVVRTSSRKAGAHRFLSFLTSTDGARIFREHGFLPVANSR